MSAERMRWAWSHFVQLKIRIQDFQSPETGQTSPRLGLSLWVVTPLTWPRPRPLTLASVFSTNRLLSNPRVAVALLTYRPQERLPDQAQHRAERRFQQTFVERVDHPETVGQVLHA